MKRLKHVVRDLFRSVWGGYRSGGISGLYHLIRCHTWNRYHVVNISGECGYDWGWIDRDSVLLYASFKILKDFVEQENPTVGLMTLEDYRYEGDEWTLESMKAQVEIEREIRDLYDWWTIQRPRDWAEKDELLDGVEVDFTENGIKVSDERRSRKWWDRERELDAKDEEMLIRLAKVRQALWT